MTSIHTQQKVTTMTKPYYQDDHVTLYHGDSRTTLRQMDSASVDCCVTSPPYYGLRDYGQEGQYGLEESPAQYVETMRALFSEVRRVLADDGTLWLNLGDSYQSSGGKINRAMKAAGIENTSHGLRGRYATMALTSANLVSVARAMGHAHMSTTARYTATSDADLDVIGEAVTRGF